MDEGTIKLHGSYRYLKERGIDFDRILRQYETDNDEYEKEEKERVQRESNMNFNVYNLSDEYSEEDSSENSEERKEGKNASIKLERDISNCSPMVKGHGKVKEEALGNSSNMQTKVNLMVKNKSKLLFHNI